MITQTKRKITWKKDDPATPALIDPMLDDIGVNASVREAVKSWCKKTIIEAKGYEEMGDLQLEACCYAAGYEDGINVR